ncbi:LamG domain-containing protein [Delftia acidovorans]|uniref:LamG domain-containing protein n=1 Tax=Delftia acidovorans TaxID=80866 RepID=UPI001EDDEAAC|nr:LamG domain-containing protein [Delftia acidovorans]MCG3783336.1 LamG domain-containing protein [Delftia acidovorans]
MPGDSAFASVSLLLHADGANGSTTLTDQSINALVPSALGGAQLSTAQKRYGTASLLSGQSAGAFARYASNPAFGFGSGDFTLEASIYMTGGSGTDRNLLDFRDANGSDTMTWFIGTSNRLCIWTGALSGDAGPSLSQGIWYDVALTRASGVFRAFVDGVLVWSASPSVDFGANRPLGVGGAVYAGGVGISLLPAYIDEVRITKGLARYTSNYTPAGPFPNGAYAISGTVRDDADLPASRTVRAYYRATGALAGSAVSDAATGAYELGTLTADECSVLFLDDAAGAVYNDRVLRVTPG